MTSARSRRGSRELGGELLVGRSSCCAAGELEFTEQDDAAATYAEKIEPGRAAARPGAPGGRARAPTVRALSPHIGAYLELEGGERLGVRAARAEPGAPPPGELERDGGRCARLRRRARCGSSRPAAGRQADGRRAPTCAAIPPPRRWRPAALSVRVSGRTAVTPARRVAFEVLRRTFERRRLDRPRLRRRGRAPGARRARAGPGRGGSPTARCSGAAPATSSIARLAAATARRGSTPPALAALRLGLYELLFSDAAADHAAVDQAVELAKGGRARRPRRRAAAGFVNAVLRRAAARARGAPRRRSTTRPPRARRSPIPTRCGWPRCGGGSSAPTEARLLLAAMNEPTETALRVNTLRAEPAAWPASSRRRRRGPRRRARRPARAGRGAGGRRGPASAVGGAGRDRRAGRRSRAARRRSSSCSTRAGRAGARPLRRARDQDDGDRGADGRGRGRRGRG